MPREKYYFGPMRVRQDQSAYSHIGIIKTSQPEKDAMPFMLYLNGPHKTKKCAIQAARYQFSFVRKWYFINCTRPKGF